MKIFYIILFIFLLLVALLAVQLYTAEKTIEPQVTPSSYRVKNDKKETGGAITLPTIQQKESVRPSLPVIDPKTDPLRPVIRKTTATSTPFGVTPEPPAPVKREQRMDGIHLIQ